MTRTAPIAASLLVLASAFSLAHAAEQIARFHGYAFDLKTNRYLYTEVHAQKIVDDQWISGEIRYFSPEGSLLGTKTLSFASDPFIPTYQYELPALGYKEAITAVGDSVTLSKTVKGSTKTASIPRKAPIAGDSGFHNFLRKHFKELMDGETVPFTFIAAGNLDSYKFRAKRIEDTTFEGKKAVRFLVEANSLLRMVAPNLIVTYDPERQLLLEYRGPSNVINPETDKVYEARIAYYAKPPGEAPKTLPPLE